MKKLLLLSLLFALLLSLSGGGTAHAFATDPLLDGVDVMSFAGEINRASDIVGYKARLTAPSYDKKTSDFAEHPVYTSRTASNVEVKFHLRDNSVLYLNISFDESDMAQMNDMMDVVYATYLVSGMSQDEIDRMAEVGKVGFGRIHAQAKADRIKAEENALQCFEDGIIRVVAGDDELTSLDEPVPAQDGVTYTFIRLTFLAGSMW